ncbi:MAG: Gfo/Idh/MocA family oxidoreductase [candidate division KSB1 bacterium]|nr:Gfo/Idh/MocA family oxidoreductase [candidate division KSB1 bacterium]
MAHDKIRLGIIGANMHYGWGTRAHLPALTHLPDYELVAVCTAHPETAQETAQAFGVPLAFHNHADLLCHPDIDAVAVVVRVPLHHQLTMDALRAGKHVYTEWPLGATLQEAQEMAALAQAQGVHTMVGLQGRFAPAFRRLKELIDEGYVGEVLACHLTQIRPGVLSRPSGRTWQRDRALGATTLTIPFGHAVDCMCMCVGEFREVSAVVSTQVPQWYETDTGRTVEVTAPDNILVSGRLATGAVASVHVASVPWHGSGMKLEVYGREGTLVASTGLSAQIDPVRLQGGRSTDRELQELPLPDRLQTAPAGVPAGEAVNVAMMYQGFAEAIRTGTRVEPDFATAVTRHQLIAAVQRASDQGERVTLPEPRS